MLEAIYYLATLTAFHADNDRQLINFHTLKESLAVTRIVADFQRAQRKHHMEIRLILEGENSLHEGRLRKEVYLDGSKRKMTEAFGHFNAVLFLPQMMLIIEGAPELRRRYLNLILAQVYSDYAAHMVVYARSLTQRNALLKQIQEKRADPEQLSYWDEQLAESGAYIIHARIQVVHALERFVTPIHSELSGNSEILRLQYLPSFDPIAVNSKQMALPMTVSIDRQNVALPEIRDGFKRRLDQLRVDEIIRGMTLVGPHRDEMRFLINGVDMGRFGSRGQIRTAMLALKLAEVAWLQERTGEWPVLLFDEVMAELDSNRRLELLERLGTCDQTFLTSADLELFDNSFLEKAIIWNVSNGRVVSGIDQRRV